ncbi:oxidoreductase-like protein [Melampsora americana]|nr:oxidoreductase-like protein [Melampsora americana]
MYNSRIRTAQQIQSYLNRSFSTNSISHHQIYVLNKSILTLTDREEEEERKKNLKKGLNTWVSVDREVLDLNHQWSIGSQLKKDHHRHHHERVLGLNFEEQPDLDLNLNRLDPKLSVLSDRIQTDNVLKLTRTEEKREEFRFLLPLKPNPPGPEDCCMSGCTHCVYEIYLDELQSYQSKIKEMIEGQEKEEEEKRFEEMGRKDSMGLGKLKSLLDLKKEDDDGLENDLELMSIKSFIKLERKLKEKLIDTKEID